MSNRRCSRLSPSKSQRGIYFSAVESLTGLRLDLGLCRSVARACALPSKTSREDNTEAMGRDGDAAVRPETPPRLSSFSAGEGDAPRRYFSKWPVYVSRGGPTKSHRDSVSPRRGPRSAQPSEWRFFLGLKRASKRRRELSSALHPPRLLFLLLSFCFQGIVAVLLSPSVSQCIVRGESGRNLAVCLW